jgi:hypothetical protein
MLKFKKSLKQAGKYLKNDDIFDRLKRDQLNRKHSLLRVF